MKTMIITGGSSGIGLALVQGYLSIGWRVINIDKNTPEIVVKGEYHYVYGDLSETETLDSIFKMCLSHTKHIDAIIHNAAVEHNSDFNRLTQAQLDEVYQVNIKAPIILSQYFSKQFLRRHGRIILITSTRAFMSEPDTIAYSMSKGALQALTHSLAMTLQSKLITVNAVAPGWIHTSKQRLKESDHNFHPSKRVGKAEDIFQACQYITNEANDFFNGQTLVVDGGVTKKMLYPE